MKIDKSHKKSLKYKNICPRTEAIYIENLRKMDGEKKLKIAFQLYEMAVNLCKQNIIESNPDITEKELRLKIFERFDYDTRRFTVIGHR